jgi:SAM-dependent methyltransferase
LDRSANPRFLPEDRYEMLTVAPAAPWYPFPPTRPGQIVADLPVEDGCYGVVLCVGALERHPEPLPLTIELTRILAPGGRLFLVAPLIVPEPPRGGPMVTTDRRRYGLNYLLDAASLRIEYLEPVERSSAYAVIACKSPSASPRDRRATDNT